jgi:ATP-dependent Clp protease ATP-binding subunit ClpB
VETWVRGELHNHFRPEFLNRVDDVILFRPLGRTELRAIVELQIQRVRGLAEELGVGLEVAPGALDLIAEEGHDPSYGARPLKRAIQRLLQDPLALYLLEGEIPEGTRILVDSDPQARRLRFQAGEAAPGIDAGEDV